MESISTRRAYMVRAKYQFNWKSPEKCKVITLVWIFKVIARKENNAPTALWGRTNRQVFINKDRKTTPKSWSLLYKMLSQLKTIYLFSAWNFFNSSSDVLFYFYAALISDIDREIVSPPLLSRPSSVWRESGIDHLTWAPHYGTPECLRRKHQNLDEARRQPDAGPPAPFQNDLFRGAACRPALTSTSPEPILNTLSTSL